MRNVKRVFVFLFVLMVAASTAAADTDALSSWNDGPAKSAIIGFVQATTDKSSSKFVPPAERIASFDQDGTLWVSHPMYAQVVYCLDRHQHDERLEAHIRVRAIAPERQDETGNVAAQGSGFRVKGTRKDRRLNPRQPPVYRQEGLFFVGVASSHDKIAARCRSHKKETNFLGSWQATKGERP